MNYKELSDGFNVLKRRDELYNCELLEERCNNLVRLETAIEFRRRDLESEINRLNELKINIEDLGEEFFNLKIKLYKYNGE